MTEAAETQTKKEKYSRQEVTSIIRSVLGSIDKTQEPTSKLHDELSKLESYIESMRTELAQMRTIDISHNQIPAASDELDAVVEETAKATGTIMDQCDKIQAVSANLTDGDQATVETAITAIFEACSFQDITGQRITKVVRTLKNIEGKVHEIMKALDQEVAHELDTEDKREGDAKLLNGPQLQGGGASQEEIDALLASFD